MLGRLLSLPKEVVRALVHAVTGGGHTPPAGPRPADAWELRQVQEQADEPAPSDSDDGHDHSHDHSHDHNHEH